MHEHILAGGALDKPVSLPAVEPLNSTFLSHKEPPFASSLRIILPSLVCLPGDPIQDIPLEGTVRTGSGVAAYGRNRPNRNGSPALRQAVARDEILWSREDEGAISHC